MSQAFEPGVRDGMSATDYHSMAALSSSGIKKLLRSPAHYIVERTAPRAPSDAMKIGTAVHTLVLEPQRAGEIIAMPGFNLRTKAGRDESVDWAEAHQSCQSFDAQTHERIVRAAEAVRAHPGAARLLCDGAAERSIFWRDAKESIECRARFDWHRDDGGIVDLKTTRDASPDAFSRSIANFEYHVSAAHYWLGAEHVLGASPAFWAFVCVEVEPPFGVACYVLDAASIRAGMARCERAYRTFRECVDSQQWPAYPETIDVIGAPSWALREFA